MPTKCPLTNIPRGVMKPLIYSFQLTEKYHVTCHVICQIKKGCSAQVKSVFNSKIRLFRIKKDLIRSKVGSLRQLVTDKSCKVRVKNKV